MNIVLSWLAVAGAAVLLVAVTVAWLEHRRRTASRHKDPAWFDTEINVNALTGATDLDLSLDHPHGPPVQRLDLSDDEREQAARQAVLAAALSRMARHKAQPTERNAWADTQPQVTSAPSESGRSKARTAVE
jgi:hypothetical protein